MVDVVVKKQGGEQEQEAYGLVWPGKAAAARLAVEPCVKGLKLCVEEGVGGAETGHVLVAGENLDALKLLGEEYGGRVGLVYIDPPYNTGKDFVYGDDFRGVRPGKREAKGDLEQGHGNWLSMIYPRLILARGLMRESGVMMVSIDDNQVAGLRLVMDEVFGEENFVAQVVVQSNKRGQTYRVIAKTHEYLLVYAKGGRVVFKELEKPAGPLTLRDEQGTYEKWELRNRNPKFGRFNRPNLYFPIYVMPESVDKAGYARVSLKKKKGSVEVFPVNSRGEEGCWRWGKEKVEAQGLTGENPVVMARKRRDGAWNIYEKARKGTSKAKSIWTESVFISEQGTDELARLGMAEAFSHPKPVELVRRCVFMATGPEDVVLDFFAGSGTTWHAVALQNAMDGGRRKCVLVQRSEPLRADVGTQRAGALFCEGMGVAGDIVEITKERMKRAGKKISEASPGSEADFGFKVFKVT